MLMILLSLNGAGKYRSTLDAETHRKKHRGTFTILYKNKKGD